MNDWRGSVRSCSTRSRRDPSGKTLGRAIAGGRSSGRRLGVDCSQPRACRAPPPEFLKRLLRRRPGPGGIGHEGQAWIRGQREGFVGEGQVAAERVMEPLDAAAVETDVVARPQDAELLARVDSGPTRSESPRSYRLRPASPRRFALICPEIPAPSSWRRPPPYDATSRSRSYGEEASGPRARRADGSQLSGSTGTALERRPKVSKISLTSDLGTVSAYRRDRVCGTGPMSSRSADRLPIMDPNAKER
jgi:hypothetical protein